MCAIVDQSAAGKMACVCVCVREGGGGYQGDDLALLKADIFKLQGIFVFDKRQRKDGKGEV